MREENIVIAFPQRDVHLFHQGDSSSSFEEKKVNTNIEETDDTITKTRISEESNEVSNLVEDLPDIIDEEVEFDNSKEGENIAVNALMDELKLLRQEMNTINDNNQLSENEEMDSLKNQISEMAEQFKDNENKQLESLKKEINILKSNQNLEEERVAKEEERVAKEENAELDEAQRLIKEIESRNSD
ncbi:MAG: hypothetical protein BEU02_00360 [Marine Group III euryarchaeote CG-Epi5]|uniref:Uncharacterized protein n=1 Tax=Marine Group III euryarchaeote CG-Epi5 TaxID=1888999 RepID=A0A1J5UD59_9ARCH|nr:MAG: hypothetical protein BEU02_00360 [Marine Group III euryarchaeote CG-Epi5]